MSKLIATVALCGALLTPHPAFAEDWAYLNEAENGLSYWIDRDSVRDMGSYRQAWTKTDYSAVPTGDVSMRKAQEDYDCGGRRMRTRSTIAYGRDGKVLRTLTLGEGESEWRAASPGTMGETKLEAVCAATPR